MAINSSVENNQQSFVWLKYEHAGKENTVDSALASVLVLSVVVHLLSSLIAFKLFGSAPLTSPNTGLSTTQNITLIKQDDEKEPQVLIDPTEAKSTANKLAATEPLPGIDLVSTGTDSPRPSHPTIDNSQRTSSALVNSDNLKANQSSTEVEVKKTQIVEGSSSDDSQGKADHGDKTYYFKFNDLTDAEQKAVVNSVNSFAENGFKRILALWIRPNKKYVIQRSGVIKLILDEHGYIVKLYIEKSSGDRALDLSVLEAAKRAKRLPMPNNKHIPPSFFRSLSLDYDSDM